MTGNTKPALALAPLALAALLLAPTSPARAAQLCGWVIETTDSDSVHNFALWLEADNDVAFFYKMTGDGIVSGSRKSYGPGSGTFSLRPHRPTSPWTYGTNIPGESDVDIVAEIHTPPKSVFSEEETPLLAKFVFKRHVPEDEKTLPKDFAKRQCATVPDIR